MNIDSLYRVWIWVIEFDLDCWKSQAYFGGPKDLLIRKFC